MTLTFDTGKAVRRLRGPLRSQAAAEAVVGVLADAQQDLVTKGDLKIDMAHLERRMLTLMLLQTGIVIAAIAAIEVLVPG